jgi:hypothetical protein
VKFQSNLNLVSFYAQDTYTRARLTLQGGLRYDGIGTHYPETSAGGPDYQLMPTQVVFAEGSTDEIHWKDITPRMAAAYDLFGNGKTAIKVNVGKYLTALTASNSDTDLQPGRRIATNTTRTWTEGLNGGIAGDYIPQCDLRNPAANGECGAMDNQNFGKDVFTKSFDPDLIHGWGKRTYNWEMGISLQQELIPRVGVTVGYFRRWFGNFYTANNRLTTTADYSEFSIPIPVDPRLPGGGGGTVQGLYNLVPTMVGREDLYSQLSSNFGEMTETWHGVDVNVNARLRNGLTVQAGTSSGRRLQDNCAVRAALPETYSWASTAGVQVARVLTSTGGLANPYCRVVEPFFTLTSFRGLTTYSCRRSTCRSVVRGAATRARARGQLCRHQRDRVPIARPQPVVGQRDGQPGRTGHALRRADQQHRHARREDPPLPRDARAGRRGHLQRAEYRRRDAVQHRLQPDRRMAHADRDSAGTLRALQPAVRFLTTGPAGPQNRTRPTLQIHTP